MLGQSNNTVIDAGPKIIKQDWTLSVFVLSEAPSNADTLLGHRLRC